jgi:V8-like Glu-specific endopeptidase
VRFLQSSILTLILTLPFAVNAQTTARLDFNDGTCSGTIVAPNVILSAAHCFEEEEDVMSYFGLAPQRTTMKVDGYQVKILAYVSDDNDHELVRVDYTFKQYSRLAKLPAVGAHVHYWGNPAGINNVYREGYVTGYHNSAMMMDINGFFGDSGAGIFNSEGNVVGVISFIQVHPHGGLKFSLMGAATPLEFTALQYDMMGVVAP